ncbi:MAG: ABC transporter ATP-binding protein [Bacteroidetes bacterium]|nr:ABC transporter ATP-binding protein [Bacteroidota bacterium]
MNHLKVLRPFFLKYKWHFLGGLLFVALSTVFKIYQGVIVREGSNRIMFIIEHGSSSKDSSVFIKHGLTLISLALISGLFMFLMRQTIIVMSRHIEYDQKNQIYEQYQKLDTRFFKQNTTGDLMNRISEDVGRVRMYTGPAIMYLANTIVTTLTVLGFMLSINVQLTLIVFLPLPILSLLIYRVSDLINKRSKRVQEELSNLTTQAQETFSAIRVIKAYARETYFTQQMQEKSETYKSTSLKLANTQALFSPTMVLMIGMSVLFTIWYGGRLTILGKIEAGNIPEFIVYVFYMTWPFASLGWVTSLIQRAAASQQRINEFLDVVPEVKNNNSLQYKIEGEIEFKNVCFTYPENNVEALKNVSFTIKKGETLAIIGGVGSGKSTIITLLTRQYDVNSGEILIDGKNIKEHNLDIIRRSSGVVTQEVFLFSDTIKNNINFGTQETDVIMAVTEEAAKDAGVFENILSFPDKFETTVGERGVTLSGGQKQRVSIARAIIGRPQLLLLDDCLSAVDVETEEVIIKNLQSKASMSTCLIVSHRISTIKHAHRIIYLNEGSISEMGTHDELFKLGRRYFKLCQLQLIN